MFHPLQGLDAVTKSFSLGRDGNDSTEWAQVLEGPQGSPQDRNDAGNMDFHEANPQQMSPALASKDLMHENSMVDVIVDGHFTNTCLSKSKVANVVPSSEAPLCDDEVPLL